LCVASLGSILGLLKKVKVDGNFISGDTVEVLSPDADNERKWYGRVIGFFFDTSFMKQPLVVLNYFWPLEHITQTSRRQSIFLGLRERVTQEMLRKVNIEAFHLATHSGDIYFVQILSLLAKVHIVALPKYMNLHESIYFLNPFHRHCGI